MEGMAIISLSAANELHRSEQSPLVGTTGAACSN